MPIYEYRCPNGHTFEVFQKMSEPAIEVCSTCGAGPVEKLLFPVAVHFKGSGFYSTDYGRGGRKSGKDGSDGAGGEKKSSDQGDKGGGDKSGGEKTGGGDKAAGETKKPAGDSD